MRIRAATSYVGIVGLATALAASSLGAQDAPLPRFGLGASGYMGFTTANASYFVGAEGFVRVAGGAFWSARVDGAYYGATPPPDGVGCVTPSPAPTCDTRNLGKLGTIMATFVAGSRATNSLRHIYALAGAGVAITRWGGGYYLPGPNSSEPFQKGVGAGPTVAVFAGGVGSEFRAFGGNRIEFRVDIAKPSTPTAASGSIGNLSGRAMSLTLGRVW